MPSRIQVSALVLYVAIVWGVSLFLQGFDVTPELLKPVSTVSGALVVILAVFDNWLWRVSILQGWFVKRPLLAGTWRATFQTSWRNPDTAEIPGPITGFMVVRQTYSRLTMTLLTTESTSQFVADELTLGTDGRFAVFAVYHNEPKVQVRHRSAMHYGAMKLTVQGKPATSLEGFYWTDRLTRGDIQLSERRKRAFDSFEDAAIEFGVS